MSYHKNADPSICHSIPVTTISGTTASAKTHGALLSDTSGGANTYTLPAPSNAEKFCKIFYDSDGTWGTNNLTLDRGNGGSIDGTAANKSFSTPGGCVIVMCDGTDFYTRELGGAATSDYDILLVQFFS